MINTTSDTTNPNAETGTKVLTGTEMPLTEAEASTKSAENISTADTSTITGIADANIVRMTTADRRLKCSCCGASATASCDCGVEYVPAGTLAAKAVAAHPEKSDRAIAAIIGVDHKTIAKARRAGGDCSPPETRIGQDGKNYPAKKEAVAERRLNAVGKPFLNAMTASKGNGLDAEASAEKRKDEYANDEPTSRHYAYLRSCAVSRAIAEGAGVAAEERLRAAMLDYVIEVDPKFRWRPGDAKRQLAAIAETVLLSADFKKAKAAAKRAGGVP